MFPRHCRVEQTLRSILCGLVFAISAANAGEEEASNATWSGNLSTGWDSLYMFRGVNQLPGFGGYGSSLSWTSLTFVWTPTEVDSLSIGNWAAFGLGDTDYKELDAYAVYTRTIGALSLSLGYALYAVLNEPGGLYSHDLNFAAGYEMRWGTVTITPGLLYAFNLGPGPGDGGYVEQSSSYLELRLDGSVPLPIRAVTLTSWAAVGFNFRHNVTGRTDPPSPFVGGDHIALGVALPIAIGERVSFAPYVATSFEWSDLVDTRPVTFWGGTSVTIAF